MSAQILTVENLARAVFRSMRFACIQATPEWAEGGNSLMQEEARRCAREIILTFAAPDPLPVAVAAELAAARAKFPHWPTDPLHAVAVIGEELGELTRALVQVTYEPGKASLADVEKEATQVAAMALRFFHNLNRYVYDDGLNQHKEVEEG